MYGGTSRLRKTIVSFAPRDLETMIFTRVYICVFHFALPTFFPNAALLLELLSLRLVNQLTFFQTFLLLARTTCSKYVVTATIMQKNGAGVHSANALWVDPSNDGIVTVKWPTDKKGDGNKTMYCIVNVLALNF